MLLYPLCIVELSKTLSCLLPSPSVNLFSWRPVFLLVAIFALRMLGLFMLMPVLSLHCAQFPDASPVMVGWCVGLYGLVQTLMQLPMGALSDRMDRRWVISLGLILLVVGSLICAAAETMWWFLVGRALQGAGAIGAAVLALIADLVPDTHRTQTMACVGLGVGAAFALALLIGPWLASWFGVHGLFFCLAGLGAFALLALWWWVPAVHLVTHVSLNASVVAPGLALLYGSVLLLHMLLSAFFVILPLHLSQSLHLMVQDHGRLYFTSLLLSVIFVWPLIKSARRGYVSVHVLALAVAVLALGVLSFVWWRSSAGVVAGLALFFAGFNVLEAALPAWASRLAPHNKRGAFLGGFASCQFMGAFAGGVLGGFCYGHFGLTGGLVALFVVASLWWFTMVMGERYLQLEPPGCVVKGT